MMTNNIKLLAAGMLVFMTSCDGNMIEQQNESNDNEITFIARMDGNIQEGNLTRTYLSGYSTLWNNGDIIKVNNNKVSLVSSDGSSLGKGSVAADSQNGFLAGYPADNTTFTDNAGTWNMSVEIPAYQTYDAAHTLWEQMPMAAYSKPGTDGYVVLEFKNAANILQLNLWGESETKVKSIVITSNYTSVPLSGKLTVNTSTTPISFNPISANQGTTVTLLCPTPVTLSTDKNSPTPFHIIIPKLASDAILTVTINNENSGRQENTITVDGTHNIQFKTDVNRIFATASKKFEPVGNGELSGLFSVSDTKQVRFSQGNMYCNTTTDPVTYLFEDNQYDYRNYNGKTADAAVINGTKQVTPAGTVGSFYWVKNTETSIHPYDATYGTPNPTNKAGDVFFTNATENSPKTDFTCNGETGVWRTLSGGSSGEWEYLCENRTDAASKYGYGTVGGVHGMIILPDSFTDPRTNTASGATDGAFIPKLKGWTNNVYSLGGNWEAMETAGAVFLPAAGRSDGDSKFTNIDSYGYYWASLSNSASKAYYKDVDQTSTAPFNEREFYYRFSVRLVKDFNGVAASEYKLSIW